MIRNSFFFFLTLSIFSKFFSMNMLFLYRGKSISGRREIIRKSNVGLRRTFSLGVNSYPSIQRTGLMMMGEGNPWCAFSLPSRSLPYVLGFSGFQKYLECGHSVNPACSINDSLHQCTKD